MYGMPNVPHTHFTIMLCEIYLSIKNTFSRSQWPFQWQILRTLSSCCNISPRETQNTACVAVRWLCNIAIKHFISERYSKLASEWVGWTKTGRGRKLSLTVDNILHEKYRRHFLCELMINPCAGCNVSKLMFSVKWSIIFTTWCLFACFDFCILGGWICYCILVYIMGAPSFKSTVYICGTCRVIYP